MPVYEFECKCGEIFTEIVLKPTGMEEATCPKCEKIAKRIFTGRVGFNENKLKMDREHEVWCESKSQRLSTKEL